MNEELLKDKEIEKILRECYIDTMKLGRTFFEENFHRPFTSLHEQLFNLVHKKPGDPGYKPKKAIVVPRGMGKTTIANMLIPAKKILYQDAKYIVPISASSTLAEQQSENLKYALLNNKKIKTIYGDLSTKQLNKQQWVVRVGGKEEGKDICIMPRGAGQQIRGLLYRGSRPDLFVVDDLEDPDNIDSEEQRAKKKRWFTADVLQAVDNYAPTGTWEVIMVGTVLHQDSLLVNVMDDPTWDVVELAICDENFKSNAPEWVSDQWVKDKYNEFKEAGEVDSFYREYMNMPVAGGEDAVFKNDYFKYYEPSQVKLTGNPNIINVLILDPARTAKMESADSAVVGVALDIQKQAIYVRDIVRGKFYPDQFYDEVFKMAQKLKVNAVGVEVTGLHEYITYPLKNEMSKRGVNFELVELQARGGTNEKGKVARIRTLVPFYRQGLVYHNRACCDVLENQLMSFPRAKLWDVMDALGYAPEMLEKGAMYMLTEYEDYDDPETIEREFRELEDEYDPAIEDFGIIDWNN